MKTIVSNNYRNVDIYVKATKNNYYAYATYGKGQYLLKNDAQCAVKATGTCASCEEGELRGILRILNNLPMNCRIQFHGAKMVKCNRHHNHKKNTELWDDLTNQLRFGKNGLARHTVSWDDEKVEGWNCDASWSPANSFPVFAKELAEGMKAKTEVKVVAKAEKGIQM